MITIGTIAKKYGQLPSHVAAYGSSYDLMIDDIMTTWENYQKNPSDSDQYKEEELLKIMKETRGGN